MNIGWVDFRRPYDMVGFMDNKNHLNWWELLKIF